MNDQTYCPVICGCVADSGNAQLSDTIRDEVLIQAPHPMATALEQHHADMGDYALGMGAIFLLLLGATLYLVVGGDK